MGKLVAVVYICGAGHSGSTLLELMLGAQPGIASFGEVPQGLTRLEQGRETICTCGQAPGNCPVWSHVIARLRRKGLAPGQRDLPRLLAARAGAMRWSRRSLQLRETYRALSALSGADLIVDSGKTAGAIRRLVGDRGLSVRLVHLVRDGRAVAFSNVRKGRDPAAGADAWAGSNAAVERLLATPAGQRAIRVRYEDLVAAPAETLGGILAALGRPPAAVELDWKRRASHGLNGNRMRLAPVAEIRPDAGYVDGLEAAEWARLTERLGPMLAAYGYPAGKAEARGLLSGTAPRLQTLRT
jgi:hypothetical protein